MVSLTHPLSIEEKPYIRDVSFSAYLNPSEEVFLRKLVEKSKINSTIAIQNENEYIRKEKVGNEEIGVFGAEKYYNAGEVEENIDYRQMIQARTPSIHSESSWNSLSSLLQGGRENSIHKKNINRKQIKSVLSTLSCNCSCGDKTSVDVNELKSQSFSKRNFRNDHFDRTNKFSINPRISEELQMKKTEDFGVGLIKEDCFTFPIVYLEPGNLESKKLVFQEGEYDKKRKSLDVFRSPILDKGEQPIKTLEKKLNLLTIETNPRREEIDFPLRSCGNFDEYESDASSDLFEIESFSTSNNSNPYLIRQDSNASSCVTPTCYAPSESSIEWSIVTASAVDFSLISDLEYPDSSFRTMENAQKPVTKNKRKEVDKKRSGIFSGCKTQKAVSVAGEAYEKTGKAGTNHILGIDSKSGRNGNVSSSLLKSHSGHSSRLLYMG